MQKECIGGLPGILILIPSAESCLLNVNPWNKKNITTYVLKITHITQSKKVFIYPMAKINTHYMHISQYAMMMIFMEHQNKKHLKRLWLK